MRRAQTRACVIKPYEEMQTLLRVTCPQTRALSCMCGCGRDLHAQTECCTKSLLWSLLFWGESERGPHTGARTLKWRQILNEMIFLNKYKYAVKSRSPGTIKSSGDLRTHESETPTHILVPATSKRRKRAQGRCVKYSSGHRQTPHPHVYTPPCKHDSTHDKHTHRGTHTVPVHLYSTVVDTPFRPLQ